MIRGRLLIVVAVIVGTILGAVGGMAWWSLFGPGGDLGSNMDGVAEVARGAVAGSVTGLLAGVVIPRARSRAELARGAVGSISAAVLFVTGVSYIGDLTNADGAPAGSYAGFAALPVSLVLAAVLVRKTRPS